MNAEQVKHVLATYLLEVHPQGRSAAVSFDTGLGMPPEVLAITQEEAKTLLMTLVAPVPTSPNVH
jgi:hypothetical protein